MCRNYAEHIELEQAQQMYGYLRDSTLGTRLKLCTSDPNAAVVS